MDLFRIPTLLSVRAGARVPWKRSIARACRLEALRDLTRRLGIDCIFDVGANVGQFGMEMRAMGYHGWLISFEPNPGALAALKRRVDDKWLVFPFALAAENAEREFKVTNSSELSSFLHPLTDAVEKRITVSVRRVDSVLDEIIERTGGTRLFLKMDTQGFDVEVVKGCGQKITAFLGLLSELSVTPIYTGMPTYVEALTVYQSLGFKLHSLHLVSLCPDHSVLEYDAIMTRNPEPAR